MKGSSLSDYDPFASAPADEAQAEPTQAPPEETFQAPPPEAAPKKAPAKKAASPAVHVDRGGEVVLTFKGGTGFDAPWIVIHAADLSDALEQVSGVNAATLVSLMERTQNAGQAFAKMGGGSAASSGARPQRQPAPAAAQQPPAGSPAAPGADWVYKSGVTKSGPKAGETWQAWMPPRGSNDKPLFF